MKISTTCIDCRTNKRNTTYTGSFQCEPCKESLINRINKNYRNIEKINESRIDFLMRMSKELNLNYTKSEIEHKIDDGYEDWQILQTKPMNVWTMGSYSKALPYHVHINEL